LKSVPRKTIAWLCLLGAVNIPSSQKLSSPYREAFVTTAILLKVLVATTIAVLSALDPANA